MAISFRESEVILNVAGEGGGYTILGELYLDHWRFWRQAGGGDAWMYEDDDGGENPISVPKERAPEPSICFHDTLDEALEEINSCWPLLHPIEVHAAFAKDILSRVDKYLAENDAHSRGDESLRWRDICNM